MRGKRTVYPWVIVAALTGGAVAETCAVPAPSGGEVRLTTRRPIVGDDVRLVSGFGMRRHPLLGSVRMHNGTDWSAVRDTPVIAAAAGRVTAAEVKSEYGETVVISHGDELETVYAHMSQIDVKMGDCVVAGTKIGGAGSTGLSSAVGVHFEVHRHGVAVDPLKETTADAH